MTYVVKIYRSIEVLWKNVYCHQLLGTGNDMRERIYKMADEIFETWPPAMLQLFEEQSQAEAETQQLNTAKQLLSTNVTQQIETLNEAGMFTLSNTHIKNLYPSSLNPFPLFVGHWFTFLGWTDLFFTVHHHWITHYSLAFRYCPFSGLWAPKASISAILGIATSMITFGKLFIEGSEGPPMLQLTYQMIFNNVKLCPHDG